MTADEGPSEVGDAARLQELARLHLRFGWIALLVFATLGAVLEALHAWKSGAYLGRRQRGAALDVDPGPRARGRAVAAAPRVRGDAEDRLRGRARAGWRSPPGCCAGRPCCCRPASSSGGVAPYEGDPGVGVVLAPIGALLLWTRDPVRRARARRAAPLSASAEREAWLLSRVRQRTTSAPFWSVS